MKNRYIFLLLFTISSALQIQAHDYQTVCANQTALFENSSNQRIKGLRIDSVKVVAADTILYPFATIQEVSAYCYSPYKASWIGEKVVIKSNGDNLFFNREGTAITLKTRALLNETWIAFQRADTFRVEASVQAVVLENVLGLSDLVKTITFRVIGKEGTTMDHDLNKLKVKISKTYGLIETLNFYHFPDIVTKYPNEMLVSYTLVGLTNPKLGLQNLTWFDVYGFNPGDELHVQEHNIGDGHSSQSVREYDNRCSYKYLERTNYADSIVYRIARKQSIKTVYADRTTLETFKDTVRSVVRANLGFDKLPGEPIFDAGSAQQMFMCDDEFLMKIRPSAMNELFTGNGNCWNVLAGEGCLPEKRYIEGLGGPYYYCGGFVGGSEERKLVYYKKGAIEWGEKLVITGVPKLKTEGHLQVFPNPARDVVIFQLNGDSEFHEVRIYNKTGLLVKTECFEGNSFKLYLTGLKRGIYLYQLTSSNSSFHSGKLVVE